MGSLVSRSFEYVLLLLIVAGGVLFVVDRYGSDDGAAPADERTPARDRETSTPTCREAGITPTSTKEGSCRTETSLLTIVDERSSLEIGQLRVRVRGATAIPATTRVGRARDRMRIALSLELVNDGPEPYTPSGDDRGIYVVAGVQRVESDAAARARPGAFGLTDPIAAGQKRVGMLRFELAGAATRSVQRSGRAQLGVRVAADRVGVVRLRFPELRGG
jgi:hypothetical protein